ncbi:MAG: type II secretion system protein [Phycisphaerae bacterium]
MKRKAFTLIELLVVISIIAMLMAVLMPALGKARKMAKDVVCKTNLHSWGYSVEMYLHDYKDSFWQGFNDFSPANGNWWLDALRVYFDDIDKVRVCPMAPTPITETNSKQPPFLGWGIFGEEGYSDFAGATGDWGSYCSNGWIENKWKESGYASISSRFWRRGSAISTPDNVPVFTAGQWFDCWPDIEDGTFTPPTAEDVYWNSSAALHSARFVQNRHDGKQNILTADGSVNSVGLKGLWTYKWHRNFDTRNRYTAAGGATNDVWPEWMKNFKEY